MAIQAWHVMKEKVSVAPEASAQGVALRLISSGLPAIPVVNDGQELLGLATEQAVLSAIQQGLDLEQFTAAALAVKAPLTADITTSPEELIGMMVKHNCCSVVVIMNNGKYAGVVSRHLLMDIYTSPHYSRFAQRDRQAPFLCL